MVERSCCALAKVCAWLNAIFVQSVQFATPGLFHNTIRKGATSFWPRSKTTWQVTGQTLCLSPFIKDQLQLVEVEVPPAVKYHQYQTAGECYHQLSQLVNQALTEATWEKSENIFTIEKNQCYSLFSFQWKHSLHSPKMTDASSLRANLLQSQHCCLDCACTCIKYVDLQPNKLTVFGSEVSRLLTITQFTSVTNTMWFL